MEENVPEECPGTGTEQSGKAAACDGCPNQKICASAGEKKEGGREEIREISS